MEPRILRTIDSKEFEKIKQEVLGMGPYSSIEITYNDGKYQIDFYTKTGPGESEKKLHSTYLMTEQELEKTLKVSRSIPYVSDRLIDPLFKKNPKNITYAIPDAMRKIKAGNSLVTEYKGNTQTTSYIKGEDIINHSNIYASKDKKPKMTA